MKKEKKDLNFIERLFVKAFINSLIKKIENMKGSWKTTLYGVLAAFGMLSQQVMALIDNDPSTVFSLEALISACVAAAAIFGLGNAARDKKVSTEAERAAGTDVK